MEEFPKAVIIGEIILGLPNQKRQNLINQFYEFEKVSIQLVFAHLWEVLPNSPAYDEEYQRKYQIEFKKFGIFGFSDVVEKRQIALNKKYNKIIKMSVKIHTNVLNKQIWVMRHSIRADKENPEKYKYCNDCEITNEGYELVGKHTDILMKNIKILQQLMLQI